MLYYLLYCHFQQFNTSKFSNARQAILFETTDRVIRTKTIVHTKIKCCAIGELYIRWNMCGKFSQTIFMSMIAAE